MSVFSEYLTNIKSKRNLNSADIAEICDLDTTSVFRWIKGESFLYTLNRSRD